jgi:hypothetical protein
LWAGSLWTIGYLVAPTLFLQLADRALAGTIAGYLFRAEAWLSVACAIILIVSHLLRRDANGASQMRWQIALPAAMLACTLLGYFALHPWMEVLREAAGAQGVMASGGRATFGILHGVSSLFYLVESLLAVALILKIREP